MDGVLIATAGSVLAIALLCLAGLGGMRIGHGIAAQSHQLTVETFPAALVERIEKMEREQDEWGRIIENELGRIENSRKRLSAKQSKLEQTTQVPVELSAADRRAQITRGLRSAS